MNKILPEKYEFSHEYCLHLHDQLASIIVYGEDEDIFNYAFEFVDEESAQRWTEQASKVTGLKLWAWLEKNNYPVVIRELARRQLIAALLSDYCQYLITSLQASEKGKLSVAYSLLRKPLKDNLLFLEWLAGKPDEFLDSFLENPIQEFAIDRIKSYQKKEIIKSALGKTALEGTLDEELLYDLRYSKTFVNGFEELWNKATHIITSAKSYATEDVNLNFIFSDWEAKLSQWDFLYDFLPLLLLYTCEIAEALIQQICHVDKIDLLGSHLLRLVGNILWIKDRPTQGADVGQLDDLENISINLAIPCKHCSATLILRPQHAKAFFISGNIKCHHCRRKNQFAPYSSITPLPLEKI